MKNFDYELLMPAGNLKKLKTAFHFGADAVYVGGKNLSLRAFADNFSEEELEKAVQYTHSIGKKIYVTANVFARNSDFETAKAYFKFLETIGADAVLISDAGMLSVCKSAAPSLCVHLSTQANTTNKYAAKFWKICGVSRIVPARELSLSEIKEIHSFVPDIELECFVHGAMCVSYSGRCLLSQHLSGRNANRGECVQPCRWNYTLTETRRHAQTPLLLEEDARGTYFMNSKDLRLLSRLKDLHDAGIVSFKVEGRMKSEFYIATVALAYRKAIDEIIKYGKVIGIDKLNRELETVAHREYTEAFFQDADADTVCRDYAQLGESEIFIAQVESYSNGFATVEMRNRFFKGDTLTVLSPNEYCYSSFEVCEIFTEEKTLTDDAKLVQHRYTIKIPFQVEEGDILRRTKKEAV